MLHFCYKKYERMPNSQIKNFNLTIAHFFLISEYKFSKKQVPLSFNNF